MIYEGLTAQLRRLGRGRDGHAWAMLTLAQLAWKVAPMFLRGLYYRPWLKSSGVLLLIGRKVVIRNPQSVSVGRNFVAEDYSEIQGLSTHGVHFGDNVTVGRFAMVRPSGYYRRELGHGLRMGNNSNLGAFCYVGCAGGVEIGDDVLISPRVSLFAENHNFERVDVPIKAQGVRCSPIVIEDDCWLASGSTILAGTRIGHGAVVAAGAVVTKDVPPYSIVAGVPAKVIGYRRPGGSAGEEVGRDTAHDRVDP